MSQKKDHARPPRCSAPVTTLPSPSSQVVRKLARRKENNQSFSSTKDSDEGEEMRFPGIPEYYRRNYEKKVVKNPPTSAVSRGHGRKSMSVDMTKLTCSDEEVAGMEEPGEEQTCPIRIRAIVPTAHPNLRPSDPPAADSTIFEPGSSPRSPFAYLCCWSSQRVR